MVFNSTDIWTLASAIVGSPIATTFLIKKFGKPVEQKIETVIQKAEPFVKELIDTPAVKLELEKAQHDIEKLTGQLKGSELGKVTATVLNAFSETLDQLSTTQKEAVILQISNMLPKEWNITKAEIESALDAAQKASDSVAEVPYIKTANQFKQDVQASQTVSV